MSTQILILAELSLVDLCVDNFTQDGKNIRVLVIQASWLYTVLHGGIFPSQMFPLSQVFKVLH